MQCAIMLLGIDIELHPHLNSVNTLSESEKLEQGALNSPNWTKRADTI